ncbi:uncharacterized protein [Sylvia atricapilla]|uniref:uncharacterized protein n=1 Tax=Sylvia atricapilla TaxID=48155 RepID=UPI003396D7D2
MAAGLRPWLLALALALWPAGLWAQLRLQETGGGLRAAGDSVTLSCHGSGLTFENHYVRWYRQAPGGRFEWVSWISHYSSQIQFGSAVEGRATASRDNSLSVASLSLHLLRAGDCARYFCAVRTEPQNQAEVEHKPSVSIPALCLRAGRGLCCPDVQSCSQRVIFTGGLSQVKTEASGPTVAKISESVWLTCHISGVAITDSSYAWDWIRQTPGKELQHMVMHVTAALVFGNGTQLTVEPNMHNTSVSQVIVMKSKKFGEGGSSGKAACLARNFLTKNISLEMPSEEVVYKQSTSVLTSEGLYNAIKVVKVTKDTEVTCTAKSDNSMITTEPEVEAEEPVTGAGAKVCNSTDSSAQDAEGQRVNMLSMAVLGLRVLLAKSIAINTLMSIKLFLF